MASSLWGSLKESEKQPPTNIVNGDIKVVEEINDGTTTKTFINTGVPPASGPRPKFRPVEARSADENTAKAISDAPPSNNFDLVGDDAGAAPAKRGSGRPRLHASDAAKQRAYRDRRKNGG